MARRKDIEELFDGTKENELKEKIKERLLKLAEGDRAKYYSGDTFWKYIVRVDERYGGVVRSYGPNESDKEDKLGRWYCGLGQIVDLTDPDIYEVIPYLLTVYMYNFYLNRNGEDMYLNRTWLNHNTMVREFLEACEGIGDKALFGAKDTGLPGVGFGNLLLRDKAERDGDFSADRGKLNTKLEYLAKNFIFPDVERFRPGENAAKDIAHKRKEKTDDIRDALDYRNWRERIVIFELCDAYATWFYIFDRNRRKFGENLKLDPVASTILFYKNLSDDNEREEWKEGLRRIGAKEAEAQTRQAILARYNEAKESYEWVKIIRKIEKISKRIDESEKKMQSKEMPDKAERDAAKDYERLERLLERAKSLPVAKKFEMTSEEERKEAEEEVELQKRAKEWVEEE